MKFPEKHRYNPEHRPEYHTKEGDPHGIFILPSAVTGGRALKVIATCGEQDGHDTGWEHVSVTLFDTKKDSTRCPGWLEMCAVKDLFWDKSECVVQFHPPEGDNINIHAGCLHLWKAKYGVFPVPPQICV